MSITDMLGSREVWERFYQYKKSLACPKQVIDEIRQYIDDGKYITLAEEIKKGGPYPLPKRSVISKMSTQKKRVVYKYPRDFNMMLKLTTYLLLRQYNGCFADNLYSFRPGIMAKDAVRRIIRSPGIEKMFFYKADVSNYFNSVPADKFIPVLEKTLEDDPEICVFLKALLTNPYVISEGRTIEDEKGIMAGSPVSSFCANLYLKELDDHFASEGILYLRYSDDIIVFAPTEELRDSYADTIRRYLKDAGLDVNPAKEVTGSCAEGFDFLGFHIEGHKVDIAPASVHKLKAKMRRKARALMRWSAREGVSGEKRAAAFIRIFNRKLMETSDDRDLTWSYWYFPVINTDESLKVIDAYAQDQIRFLVSGTRTKSRYNVRYTDLKALGYKSLVNAYYIFGEKYN